MTDFPEKRMRRLRADGIREMIRETELDKSDLIAPLFADATKNESSEIPSMPGIKRYPVEEIENAASEIEELGIPAVILFGIPREKDEEGSRAYAENGVVQRATERIKGKTDLTVITDLCLCEYTTHGHCGVLDESGETTVDNDATLPLLGKTAVSQARAGADLVAPSGMMDGMVGEIRRSLDESGYPDTGILSYSVKYNSSFYGPFRDAADSSPSFGDRRHYQMDPGNKRTAIEEAQLDIREGADVLMVKPGLPYLDVIERVSTEFNEPLAAYNVSGEYAMLKAADSQGWLDAEQTALESLLSIKRAGADLIISYFARELVEKDLI